jgi:hypothetical protein
VGSFKVKLVAYFLLLSLLPIVAAFWGFSSVAGQSETRRVDARLQSGLRSVLSSYQQRLDAAQQEANALARAPAFQAELRRHDLPALVHLLHDAPNVAVSGVDGHRVGHPPAFSATRQVAVVTRDGLVGTVTVAVPFDEALVDVLRARSGLPPTDALVIVHGARIVASSPTVVGRLTGGVGQTRTVRVPLGDPAGRDPLFRLRDGTQGADDRAPLRSRQRARRRARRRATRARAGCARSSWRRRSGTAG